MSIYVASYSHDHALVSLVLFEVAAIMAANGVALFLLRSREPPTEFTVHQMDSPINHNLYGIQLPIIILLVAKI